MNKSLLKRLYLCLGILFLCIPGLFGDAFRLSPDYRPKKITIFWAGWDEEREHSDYEYDKKGQLVKTSVFRGDESPSWYDVFEYNKDSRLIKKSTFSKDGLSAYALYTYYNEMLYEEAEFDKDGNYTRLVLHEYDKKGNLFSVSTKQTEYDTTSLTWNSLLIFQYDAEQRISGTLEYYDGTLYSRTVYEYKENSLVMTSLGYGDLRDVNSRTLKSFIYIDKGKNKGKLKELENKSLYLYDGKEEIECCTSFSMKPEYGSDGNMSTLSFFNCENELSGSAVIIWEKGKTDSDLIKKIFEQIHWYFTGC